jgi:putative transposase
MSRTISVSTGAAYGLERVCLVWERARSTLHDPREREQRRAEGITSGKRGPKPLVPDAGFLDLIRRDLAASPFVGERPRKVWGRLRFGHLRQSLLEH